MEAGTSFASAALRHCWRSALSRSRTAILIFIVSSVPAVFGGSAQWNPNPGSGDWNTATNWTPATIPNASTDTATFDMSSVTNVSLSANVTVDGTVFDSSASAFTIDTGSNFLFFTGAGITNNSGVTQNFTTGAGIEFHNSATAGTMTVITNNAPGSYTYFRDTSSGGSAAAVNADSTASIDISGLTNGGTTLGSIAGNGFLYLGANTLTVGSLNTNTTFSGSIQDGGMNGGMGGALTKVGTGTLTLSGASTYTGVTTIDNGVLKVTGSITNDQDFNIGGSNAGQLVISNGGSVSNSGSTITGGGKASLTGVGSTWMNNGDMQVGLSSSGTLDINSGGALSNNNGFVGENGTATATVDGAGSSWQSGFSLFIGEGATGNGTLNVTNGAKVSSGSGFVGDIGTGMVKVDGASSNWTMNGDLQVGNGNGATGNLAISNGGTVSNNGATIGNGNNATSGMVTVDGAGSKWTNTNDVFVGLGGSGTLQVTNGATVSNANGFIGTGSTGGATVDGVGSTWTNTGDLVVSNGGVGTLTISNSASVSSNTTTIGNQGTVTDDSSLSSPNGVFVQSGGLLKGLGTVTGNTLNDGTVSPGSASLGTLHIVGSYQQNNDGTFDITIGSLVFYDKLDVSTTAMIDGTLDVSLAGYTGHAGDVFTILSSSGLTGNFSTINLPGLSGGLAFVESTDANNVYLTVEAVPEASTWAAGLLTTGTLLISFLRRRARSS